MLSAIGTCLTLRPGGRTGRNRLGRLRYLTTMRTRLLVYVSVALMAPPALCCDAQSAPIALSAPIAAALAAPRDTATVRLAFAPGADMASRQRCIALLRQLADSGGVMTPVRVERLGDRMRAITLRATRVAREVVLVARLAPDDTSRLLSLEHVLTRDATLGTLPWPTAPLPSRQAVATAITRNLDVLARAQAFSGVVRIMYRDSLVLERGLGLADREHGVRNTSATRFAIASIGKMFTGVAIAQLIDEGRLRWDDTVAAVLPAYPNRDRAGRITVRQLLSHSAGLGSLFDDPRFKAMPAASDHFAMASSVADAPLRFAPGSRSSYSNEGFVVLGAIVERLSGMSFEQFVRTRVFAPAGMTRTIFADRDEVVTDRAIGYRPSDDDLLRTQALRANWSFIGGRGSAAGGEYSTAEDLSRFLAAWRAGTLMRSTTRDTMLVARSVAGTPTPSFYGYGVLVSTENGRLVVGHGGGGQGSGMDNDIRIFADGTWTVVVLSNEDPPGASDLSAALVRFLARQP